MTEKEQLLEETGLPYTLEGTIPMFKPTTMDEVAKLRTLLAPKMSWGYYLTKELKATMLDDPIELTQDISTDDINEPHIDITEKIQKEFTTDSGNLIAMCDKNDNTKVLNTFTSLQAACDYFNDAERAVSIKSSISKCLSGKVKSSNGYFWKYI